MTGMPSGLVYCLLYELQSREIVSSTSSALYALTNEQVLQICRYTECVCMIVFSLSVFVCLQIQEGVLLKYSGTPCCDHLQIWAYPLLNFFSNYLRYICLFVKEMVQHQLIILLCVLQLLRSIEVFKYAESVISIIDLCESGDHVPLMKYKKFLLTFL